MKILITGANGFLANYVIQYLIQQKNIEIIGIDFVEVNPARDNKNKSTMNLALNLILALLSNYE